MLTPTLRTAVAALACSALLAAGVAGANTSHEGWPRITGRLIVNKADASRTTSGTRRNDELLGGHGSDTIYGSGGDDVLWGDYKPSGQPTTQRDRLFSGPGDDFIYAGHGRDVIVAGAGADTIHAHFGHGIVDCGPGPDTLFISHRSRPGYRLHGCERISYRTLGH